MNNKALYSKFGTYGKLLKVIDSSYTIDQLYGCARLVNLFYSKYLDGDLMARLFNAMRDRALFVVSLNRSVERLIEVSLY